HECAGQLPALTGWSPREEGMPPQDDQETPEDEGAPPHWAPSRPRLTRNERSASGWELSVIRRSSVAVATRLPGFPAHSIRGEDASTLHQTSLDDFQSQCNNELKRAGLVPKIEHGGSKVDDRFRNRLPSIVDSRYPILHLR